MSACLSVMSHDHTCRTIASGCGQAVSGAVLAARARQTIHDVPRHGEVIVGLGRAGVLGGRGGTLRAVIPSWARGG